MEQICQAAVEVSQAALGSPGSWPCEETRFMALQILEAVEVNGIVPPWTLIAPLVALTSDPSR